MSAAVWHETQWAATRGDRPASRGGGGPRSRPEKAYRDASGVRESGVTADGRAAVGALAGGAGCGG